MISCLGLGVNISKTVNVLTDNNGEIAQSHLFKKKKNE